MHKSQRLIRVVVAAVFAAACQSSDLVMPSTRARAPTASGARDCTPIDPSIPSDCGPDSIDGGGGTIDPNQSSFWPTGFFVIFTVGGVEYTGEAAFVSPMSFGNNQTYNYIGYSTFGSTCIGEINMSVIEAVALNSTGVVTFGDFSMTCF